jgi:hypothetical protein
MKTFAFYAALTAVVGTLVATTVFESFESLSPGEARREWRERRRAQVGQGVQ